MTAPGSESDRPPVTAGPVDDLPVDRCRIVAEGTVVVIVSDGGPRAYRNRCPHNGLPLDGGWVTDGVLTCPHHFWRFDAATGAALVGGDGLDPLAAETVDGQLVVEPPVAEPVESFRERQLRHARQWRRDEPGRR